MFSASSTAAAASLAPAGHAPPASTPGPAAPALRPCAVGNSPVAEFDLRLLASPCPPAPLRPLGPALTAADMAVAMARDRRYASMVDAIHAPLVAQIGATYAFDALRLEVFGRWVLANRAALAINIGPDDNALLAGCRVLAWLPGVGESARQCAQAYVFILYHMAAQLGDEHTGLHVEPIAQALAARTPAHALIPLAATAPAAARPADTGPSMNGPAAASAGRRRRSSVAPAGYALRAVSRPAKHRAPSYGNAPAGHAPTGQVDRSARSGQAGWARL